MFQNRVETTLGVLQVIIGLRTENRLGVHHWNGLATSHIEVKGILLVIG